MFGRQRLRHARALPTFEQLLVALLLLGVLVGAALLVDARLDRLAEPPLVLLRARVAGSRQLDVALDVIIVIDDSGSTRESDSDGHRRSEGRLVTDWFARHSGDDRDRLAAATFDTEVRAAQPLLTASGGVAAIHRVVDQATGRGSSTDIVSAIDWARDQCRTSGDHRSVLLLFTDGAQGPDLSGGFDGLREAMATVGCDAVWLIALTQGEVFDAVSDEWAVIPLAGQVQIDEVAPGTVAEAIAQVVLIETGQDADGPVVEVR